MKAMYNSESVLYLACSHDKMLQTTTPTFAYLVTHALFFQVPTYTYAGSGLVTYLVICLFRYMSEYLLGYPPSSHL